MNNILILEEPHLGKEAIISPISCKVQDNYASERPLKKLCMCPFRDKFII